MKAKYSISTMVALLALLAFSVPVQASKKDRGIELSVTQSHMFKTFLKSDKIKVQCRGGAVTLTGVVSENFRKSLAQETAFGLPGVESVDNKLKVKHAAKTANTDAALLDNVKITLLFHRSVNAATTKVDVNKGVVTLKGAVGSLAQKELTTENVRDVEGVTDVRNEMKVSDSATKTKPAKVNKIDDASINAAVKLVLLNHRSTNVLSTTLKTKSGEVTVGGKARNEAEKSLVTKLVADVEGVESVQNRMTLE
jgi:osmotically-inducible protein OsmY